jgi:hypothetical protein
MQAETGIGEGRCVPGAKRQERLTSDIQSPLDAGKLAQEIHATLEGSTNVEYARR